MANVRLTYLELDCLLSDVKNHYEIERQAPQTIRPHLIALMEQLKREHQRMGSRYSTSQNTYLLAEDLTGILPILIDLLISLHKTKSIFFFNNIYNLLINHEQTDAASKNRKSISIIIKLLDSLKYQFGLNFFTVDRTSILCDLFFIETFRNALDFILLSLNLKLDEEEIDAFIHFCNRINLPSDLENLSRSLLILNDSNLLTKQIFLKIHTLESMEILLIKLKILNDIDLYTVQRNPVFFDQILDNKNPTLLLEFFETHPHNNDEGLISAVLSCENITSQLAALKIYQALDETMKSRNCLIRILNCSDPESEVKALTERQIQFLEEQVIQPLDVAGQPVVTKESEFPEKNQAAQIIQNAARRHLHTGILNKISFFSNKKYTRNKLTTIPESLQHMFSKSFQCKPIYESATHATDNLSSIVHSGRLYPSSICGKEGISSIYDSRKGDRMMVFTSLSHELYGKSEHFCFSINALFRKNGPNQRENVFFKFYDWAVINIDVFQYESLTDSTSVRLKTSNDQLIWEFKHDKEIYQVQLPLEDYVYHGYTGLNKYISFFLFKVIDQLPVKISQEIYTELYLLNPSEIIERFQSLMKIFFTTPELDYIGVLKLDFMMVKRIYINSKNIDCDETRKQIQNDNVNHLECLFSSFDTRKIFHHSYFLTKGIQDYATKMHAKEILGYIEKTFTKTFNLEKLAIEPSNTQPTTHSENKIRHLVDTNGRDELEKNSLTVSQINAIIRSLQQKRNEIIANLNADFENVLSIIKECKTLFKELQDVSDYGFITHLKRVTVDNVYFYRLISDEKKLKTLLYLAAVGNDHNGLDYRLIDTLDEPLFIAHNEYTKTKLIGFIDGFRPTRQNNINLSMFADLLYNIPVATLFVTDNGENTLRSINQSLIEARLSVYIILFENIKAIANECSIKTPYPSDSENALKEKYDPKKWAHYKERFLSISRKVEGYDINDGGGTISEKITANNVIHHRLVLTEEFSHYALDPQHLKSILGSNYGNFKATLFNVIEELITDSNELIRGKKSHQDYEMRVTGIQLFYRLILLEHELTKKTQLISVTSRRNTASLFFDYTTNICNDPDEEHFSDDSFGEIFKMD